MFVIIFHHYFFVKNFGICFFYIFNFVKCISYWFLFYPLFAYLFFYWFWKFISIWTFSQHDHILIINIDLTLALFAWGINSKIWLVFRYNLTKLTLLPFWSKVFEILSKIIFGLFNLLKVWPLYFKESIFLVMIFFIRGQIRSLYLFII